MNKHRWLIHLIYDTYGIVFLQRNFVDIIAHDFLTRSEGIKYSSIIEFFRRQYHEVGNNVYMFQPQRKNFAVY